MKIRTFDIKGPVELIPTLHKDSRGGFFESFNKHILWEYRVPTEYVQDNESFSKKGVIRGLHFQKPPYEQNKLVRVIKGLALDVMVDLREGSPTFGKHLELLLDGELRNMLFVPKGFAHGFAALEDCIFSYKCSEYYHKESESGIRWDDPTLGIKWEIDDPIISEKDAQLPPFFNIKEVL